MDTDPALAEHIRMLPTSRMALQEARKQTHRRRADWLEVNVAMMDKVLEKKFLQHRSLRHMLRDTGSRELIEDSLVCALPPSRDPPSSYQRRSMGSGELGMMAGDVTSSVKHLCDYESDCKPVKRLQTGRPPPAETPTNPRWQATPYHRLANARFGNISDTRRIRDYTDTVKELQPEACVH
jgi:hypothetical protein